MAERASVDMLEKLTQVANQRKQRAERILADAITAETEAEAALHAKQQKLAAAKAAEADAHDEMRANPAEEQARIWLSECKRQYEIAGGELEIAQDNLQAAQAELTNAQRGYIRADARVSAMTDRSKKARREHNRQRDDIAMQEQAENSSGSLPGGTMLLEG